jgi:hypothetical protein
VIGDVSKQSVSEIWNGDSLRELQVAMLAGQRKCIDLCSTCSAPMVCVEEDLDNHVDAVINAIGGVEDLKNINKNRWLQPKKQDVNSIKIHR